MIFGETVSKLKVIVGFDLRDCRLKAFCIAVRVEILTFKVTVHDVDFFRVGLLALQVPEVKSVP